MKQDVNLQYVPTWCPGCGNFGIFNALKKALNILQLDLDNTVLVNGIGCAGKIGQYINAYRIEALHGRSLPVATGIKLANYNLTVIAEGGDGDGTGLGIGHLIHTARRNLDIAYFIHNNQIYGLTKGQSSPTSDLGTVTKFTTAPLGNTEQPVNIVRMALSAGATFVARAFTGDIAHLADIMAKAIKHPGFAVVDILQPCVSFNQLNTYKWYQERIYRLDSILGYDEKNYEQALLFSAQWSDKIPLGIFFQIHQPTLTDYLPQLKDCPLAEKTLEDIDIQDLMQELGN